MAYTDLKSNNKIKLVINGQEIPMMSGYSYYDAKSFFKEPERSATGRINNLNSYATFLTPRLRFNFNLMPIGAYRIIMKLIKEYNEFIVSAYDIVEDEYVTHKMYFYPSEFPEIYQKSLEVLRIQGASFEMVGTNANLEDYSLVYNSNATPAVTTGLTFYYGQEVVIGSYDEDVEGAVDPIAFENSGYKLVGWNTMADYSGVEYLTGETIMMSKSMVLYAHWLAETSFILSYDYQGATSGDTTINKVVIQGNAIGTLPTPVKNGYTFGGWFTQMNGLGTEITTETVYSVGFNLTVYAKWVGVNNTLSFDNGTGEGEMSSETVASGASFTLPKCTFTKSGNAFIGWAKTAEGETVIYSDEQTIIMPASNLTLYALFEQAFYLTYNTNGGSNDSYAEFGKTFKTAIYTEKYEYALAGWYGDPEFTVGITFPLTIEENKTIYAKWVVVE